MNSEPLEIAIGWVRPNAVDLRKYMTEERQELLPSSTSD